MSHTLHEAMMVKKKILQEKFKELGKKELFEKFWELYYPKKVEGSMSINAFNRWLLYCKHKNNSLYSNYACPFCVQHKDDCNLCQYGKAFGVCNHRDPNTYEQALYFLENHYIDL